MRETDVVRLGLVGLGAFSSTVGEAVQRSQKARLVACFDVAPERRIAASKKYGCAAEESYEKLVQREDIDAVLLVTPNAFHCEQAVLASQHGKHVYVEKPIANTLADGQKMIDACEKAGVVLMVGHYRRRNSHNRKIKQLLDQGAIGKPILAEGNVSHSAGFDLTPDKFRWKRDDTGCPAGALMTMGIHLVDTFNYLFGPIESVSAYFSKLYIPAEVDDVTISMCRFTSGILGYIGANYASPKAAWMYIYGTEANLHWSAVYPNVTTERSFQGSAKPNPYTRLTLFAKGKEPQEVSLPPVDPYLEEIDEFADCIRNGSRPETDGVGALVALAYIRASIDSACTGQSVKIPIVDKKA